jgi:hypothetical protein
LICVRLLLAHARYPRLHPPAIPAISSRHLLVASLLAHHLRRHHPIYHITRSRPYSPFRATHLTSTIYTPLLAITLAARISIPLISTCMAHSHVKSAAFPPHSAHSNEHVNRFSYIQAQALHKSYLQASVSSWRIAQSSFLCVKKRLGERNIRI